MFLRIWIPFLGFVVMQCGTYRVLKFAANPFGLNSFLLTPVTRFWSNFTSTHRGLPSGCLRQYRSSTLIHSYRGLVQNNSCLRTPFFYRTFRRYLWAFRVLESLDIFLARWEAASFSKRTRVTTKFEELLVVSYVGVSLFEFTSFWRKTCGGIGRRASTGTFTAS
jgi:hypothetical protein